MSEQIAAVSSITLEETHETKPELVGVAAEVMVPGASLFELKSSLSAIKLELAKNLRALWETGGQPEHLDECISLLHEALYLYPEDHPKRLELFSELAIALWARFEEREAQEDLDESIQTYRAVLELQPSDHPGHSDTRIALAVALATRFEEYRSVFQDVEEAIGHYRVTLNSRPVDHAGHCRALTGLATSILTRYKEKGELSDLDESIHLGCASLEACPPGHPDRDDVLNNLAISLWTRFERNGHSKDLEDSITLHREAIQLRPEGHPEHDMSSSNLALVLSSRFEQKGNMDDLDEAIRLNRAALCLRPLGNAARPLTLSNLATDLTIRFQHHSDRKDLNEAIRFDREALELRPVGHPRRDESLNNLSVTLSTRFDNYGDPADLEEALRLEQDALALRPVGHPQRIISLANLMSDLSARYEAKGNIEDLDQSIQIGVNVLELYPVGHPKRSMTLRILAYSHLDRYDETSREQDLDDFLRLLTKAFEELPSGHPEKSLCLHDMCDIHSRSDTKLYNPRLALAQLSQAVAHDAYDARRRLSRAGESLRTLARPHRELDPDIVAPLSDVFRLTVDLFPQVVLLETTVHRQLRQLRDTDAIAAYAAYYAHCTGQQTASVEVLEAGRGAIWAQALRLRHQLDGIPDLYREELVSLAQELEVSLSRPQNAGKRRINSDGDEDSRKRAQRRRFEAIVSQVRMTPGMHRFLLPQDFSRLSQCAERGPVVVLTSSPFACMALVMPKPNTVRAVELDISHQDLVRMAEQNRNAHESLRRQMRKRDGNEPSAPHVPQSSVNDALRTLWMKVVKPVLENLGIKKCDDLRQRSRLWWCLARDFTWLPVHAAGAYDLNAASECCSDFVVSSYVPTINALTRARQEYVPANRKESQLLLAAVPDPDPRASMLGLPGVRREVLTIRRTVPSYAPFPLPPQDDPLLDPSRGGARTKTVIKGLSFACLLHLACHGKQEASDALKSGFCMRDGMLTIEQLIRRPFPKAFFAFLSACETARGDESQPDQVIHLAAAMLFAGFKSVIGTMWSMDDEDGEAIAEVVYRRMYEGNGEFFEPDTIPFALDEAVRELRAKHPDPSRWALYVHMGL